MSAFGKRTSRNTIKMSAFGGKADTLRGSAAMSAFDPSRHLFMKVVLRKMMVRPHFAGHKSLL
jgi:hypothetical protein